MNEEYQKYCQELIKSGNYSRCFLNEATSKYCPDLESLKRMIRDKNLTTNGALIHSG